MRLFWREDEHDNPAWPGLVDLFAFTMVIFLLFLVLQASGEDRLKSQDDRLRAEVKRLQAKIDIFDGQSRTAMAERLQKQGEKCLIKIRDELSSQMPVRISIDVKSMQMKVNILNKRYISFDTAQWKLANEDKKVIRDYAPVLFNIIKNQPVILTINGSADPRNYYSPTPPCDNVDLSALRAATVARILDAAAPGIVNKIQVVGLGAKGELVDDTGTAEEEYRKYRSLTFIISVKKDEMMDSKEYFPNTHE